MGLFGLFSSWSQKESQSLHEAYAGLQKENEDLKNQLREKDHELRLFFFFPPSQEKVDEVLTNFARKIWWAEREVSQIEGSLSEAKGVEGTLTQVINAKGPLFQKALEKFKQEPYQNARKERERAEQEFAVVRRFCDSKGWKTRPWQYYLQDPAAQ